MTHGDLVKRACRWLSNSRRCRVVLAEPYGGHYIPDALGFRFGGNQVIQVECKTSRADFTRDLRKWQRRSMSNHDIGDLRYYLTPRKLLPVNIVPDPWGLLEVRGRVIREIKPPVRVTMSSFGQRQAIAILMAAHCRQAHAIELAKLISS